VLAAEYEAAARLAGSLPSTLYMGSSSWGFPGWYGIVYSRRASQQALARDGLAEYARHPLLRTVGIDRGFYAPIPAQDLERYAGQLPAGYPCCTKAPALVTSSVHFGHGWGVAGQANPDFLSPGRFMELMGEVFISTFREHTGPFIFEFPPVPAEHRPSPEAFAERLDRFFAALPRELPYAVELRDRTLLSPAYREVLATRGVAHVYNYWRAMPLPAAQARLVPVETAPFAVIRLLLPPGTQYEERKAAFAPFDRIQEPDEAMRSEVEALVRQAEASGRKTYVLVNNKAEGSSPLTVKALAERLASSSRSGTEGWP
jgi:uncharacterized protein YecE (DUF72 family)